MDIIFNKENHSYFINGNVIPSVTQIINTGVTYPDTEKIRVAREYGNLIHEELFTAFVLGVTPNSDEGKDMFKRIKGIIGNEKYELLCEYKLAYKDIVTNKYLYAGMADLIIVYNNDFVVVDYKTGVKNIKKHTLQLSMYALALEQMLNKQCSGIYISYSDEIIKSEKNTLEEVLKVVNLYYGDYSVNLSETAVEYLNLLKEKEIIENKIKDIELDVRSELISKVDKINGGAIKTNGYSITYKKAYTRTSLDSAKIEKYLTSQNEDISKYQKTSEIKENIIFKKEKEN